MIACDVVRNAANDQRRRCPALQNGQGFSFSLMICSTARIARSCCPLQRRYRFCAGSIPCQVRCTPRRTPALRCNPRLFNQHIDAVDRLQPRHHLRPCVVARFRRHDPRCIAAVPVDACEQVVMWWRSRFRRAISACCARNALVADSPAIGINASSLDAISSASVRSYLYFTHCRFFNGITRHHDDLRNILVDRKQADVILGAGTLPANQERRRSGVRLLRTHGSVMPQADNGNI